MVKKDLCGLTADEIFELIDKSGFTPAHAVSISNNIYKKGISDIARFVNIPAPSQGRTAKNRCKRN